MSERLGATIALLALVAGGCAPAAATGLAPRSDAGTVQDAGGPTNFASPEDILRRYPAMRHQQL